MAELSNINKLILSNRIRDFHEKNGVVNILEFGCGFTTDLLLYIRRDKNYNIQLDSFTHLTSEYNSNSNNDFHSVKKRQLLTCSDSSYNRMLSSHKYNSNFMVKCQQNPNKKLCNTFYQIKNNDLKPNYDIIIISGPNGNGRDISFLHIKDKIKKGGFILIDKLDRYVSIERKDEFFNTVIAFQNITPYDRVGFYKIIENYFGNL